MKSEIIKKDTPKESHLFMMGCMYTTINSMDPPVDTIVLCSDTSNTELFGVVIYCGDQESNVDKVGFDNDGDSWNINHFTRFHGTIQLTD